MDVERLISRNECIGIHNMSYDGVGGKCSSNQQLIVLSNPTLSSSLIVYNNNYPPQNIGRLYTYTGYSTSTNNTEMLVICNRIYAIVPGKPLYDCDNRQIIVVKYRGVYLPAHMVVDIQPYDSIRAREMARSIEQHEAPYLADFLEDAGSTNTELLHSLRTILKRTYMPCKDCNINTSGTDYYMATDSVWLQAHDGERLDGHLCLSCLSNRLKRPLRLDDFADVLINDYNQFIIELRSQNARLHSQNVD